MEGLWFWKIVTLIKQMIGSCKTIAFDISRCKNYVQWSFPPIYYLTVFFSKYSLNIVNMTHLFCALEIKRLLCLPLLFQDTE